MAGLTVERRVALMEMMWAEQTASQTAGKWVCLSDGSKAARSAVSMGSNSVVGLVEWWDARSDTQWAALTGALMVVPTAAG